jgi:hypothetical protein
MRITLAAIVGGCLSACATATTVMPGPRPDKIIVTKTDSFIGLTSTKAKLCTIEDLSVSACQEIKFE